MSRYRSQIKEVINRNTVISLALEQGFNAFVPVYDGGVDFILYRESDLQLRKVQMKARWTIDRKYRDRDIWIAFPAAGDWYLMPHDMMMATAGKEGITRTKSWIEDGIYSKPKLSLATISSFAPYRFSQISQVAAESAKKEDYDRFTWKEGDLEIYDKDGNKIIISKDAGSGSLNKR